MVSRKRPLTEGGYDYQFVDPGPTDSQKCPICHLVVRDAHQVTCCGKLFCNGCFMECLSRSDSCPLCRKNTNGKHFQDTRVNIEIKDLKVYCDNKKSGCDWIGELRDVEKHMGACIYRGIECGDCHQSLLKLELKKHLTNDCPERKHICPSCSAEGTYRSITTEHQDTCPEVELVCQNAGCTAVVKRFEMSSHTEKCPKEKVKCPFYYQGCGFVCERENALTHVERNIPLHVEMIRKDVPRPTAPVTIKIDKFSLRKEKGGVWHSNGFYTGPGGYKVRLNVYPNGSGDGKSTHISVFISLMPGENDDNLEFPMRGKFYIELLNQAKDYHHYDNTLSFMNDIDTFMKKSEMDEAGYGRPQFIKHSSLVNESKGIRYLANDVIYFRVTVETFSTTKPWLVETVFC